MKNPRYKRIGFIKEWNNDFNGMVVEAFEVFCKARHHIVYLDLDDEMPERCPICNNDRSFFDRDKSLKELR